jgi:hypothetical protein
LQLKELLRGHGRALFTESLGKVDHIVKLLVALIDYPDS